ncbi:MAG TPA: tyrosine-protein phosphatase [Humisphaera sp.]|nr:tyrosine-protein phosphatase [Humisphaera sp.]
MPLRPVALWFATLFLCGGVAGCSKQPIYRRTETLVLKPPLLVKPQAPVEGAVVGVPNFGMISRDVWRGGEPSAEGLRMLGTLGVKTIMDLREADESDAIPAGVRYVRVPVSAWRADQVDVARVVELISTSPKPVFIHCRQGRDRTGLAIAAYRLWQGMSVNDTIHELRAFHVNWWWDGPICQRIQELHRQGFSSSARAMIRRDDR